MLFLDRVPKSAAVNTAAELAKSYGKKSGYVNGLLRNLDRKKSSITYPGPENPVKRLSVLYSHPEWLVNRWVERFGIERTEILLQKNNVPAPLIVRTNVLKTTRHDLKASLEGEGARVIETAYSTIGLQVISSPSIPLLTSYQQGRFIVQDQAAQLVSMMLSPQPGSTVLDACAAPGGKATHLAEIMGNRGTVIALERDPTKIGSIIENSRRLGITILRPVQGDATQYCQGLFDRILIDAPCSGLGVLRRHPDGRWTKSEKTVRGKKPLQERILENCSRLLKRGGVLVYATCTTEPEENEDVINNFLALTPAFALDDPRPFLPGSAEKLIDINGFFRTMPAEPEIDGFFGARLVKKS
jgi:16S rRNA (cytosine967-C5)-methyltransferase